MSETEKCPQTWPSFEDLEEGTKAFIYVDRDGLGYISVGMSNPWGDGFRCQLNSDQIDRMIEYLAQLKLEINK